MSTAPAPKQTPTLHDIEQVSDGWIKKYNLTYTLPDGSLYSYESVSRKGMEAYRRELERAGSGAQAPDAICIVPRTAEDELVLIREFRYPLNSWCIAFPAGLIEEDEDLATCLERELREETGYGLALVDGTVKYHALPQAGYSSTGLTEESVQVVYAFVQKKREAEPEPSEFIEVFTLPIADVAAFLEGNTTPIGTRCQLILESFARDARNELQRC
ncbi:NUDIX hydrolase [Raoultibacter phocaeensis]|uniref:NUDIX hydrolase n=1 Tax=Raoultibacter phocaeensis TaxID=2479841 RepID=UPI00111AFA15|nr:NUDIX hydrolase [Raoultibacter phocaeensis]